MKTSCRKISVPELYGSGGDSISYEAVVGEINSPGQEPRSFGARLWRRYPEVGCKIGLSWWDVLESCRD